MVTHVCKSQCHSPADLRHQLIIQLNSTVVEVENEDVLSTDFDKFIHHLGAFVFLHHAADGYPILLFQSGDGRCPPARCNDGSGCQLVAGNVVLTNHIFACGDYSRDSLCNKINKGGQVRVLGYARSDENRFRFENSCDGVQPSGSHCVTGFCNACGSGSNVKDKFLSPTRSTAKNFRSKEEFNFHGVAELTNTVCEAECAGSLNTPPNVFYLSAVPFHEL